VRLRLRERILAKWDTVRGLDFNVPVQAEAVGLNPMLSHRYAPSGNRFLVAILKDLAITPLDSIIDIGCGKGSAMRVMRRFPFGRVAGVEISATLAKIAESNFSRMRGQNIEIYCEDASSFSYYSLFNMVYLYNPFPEAVMDAVMKKLASAWVEPGKERFVIYNNPTCHTLLVENGFQPLADYPDEWGNGIRLYRHRSSEDTASRA
jgi:protein-L-isoaspartate O-methyltransferase